MDHSPPPLNTSSEFQKSDDITGQLFEGLSVQMTPAPFGKRTLAFCVDLGVINILIYLIMMALGLVILAGVLVFGALEGSILAQMTESQMGMIVIGVGVIALVLLLAAISHGYFIYYEYHHGQTIGKRMFGIRVVSLDGNRLTLRQCITREALRWVDFILGFFPVLIVIFTNERMQRLGDMASKTMVIYSEDKEKQEDFLYMEMEDYEYWLERLRPSAITEEEAEDYLRFAFAVFLAQTVTPDQKTLNHYYSWVKDKVTTSLQNLEDNELNTTKLMKFMAEYCLQTTNQKNS